MGPSSLRFRLLALSGVTIAVALVVAGFAISAIFAAHVQRGLLADLEAQQGRLVALVGAPTAGLTLSQPMPDPRYQTPGGGMYWQVSDPQTGESIRSRSLWEASIPSSTTSVAEGATATVEFVDPAGNPALALVRRLAFVSDDGTTARTLDVFVAEGLAATAAANAAFRNELAVALAVLGIALLAASWVQVALGLAPLALVRRGIAGIRTRQTIALDGSFPDEVAPLVGEVNELLAAQEASITFARHRAADLAHGLKTSLTLLNAQAQTLRRFGNLESAAAIEELSASMTETVEHQLLLSRLRQRRRSNQQATAIGPVADKIIATLRKMPPGDQLAWNADIASTAAVALDRMDLLEMLGAVLENAAKWAAGRVDISARSGAPGKVCILVDDDGAGVDDAAIRAIGARGVRADEKQPGSGLGLSIVKEIVGLNHGEMLLGRSRLGGLRVAITMPAGSA